MKKVIKKSSAKKMQMGGTVPVPKNLVKKGPVKEMKKAFKDFEADKDLKNNGFKEISKNKMTTKKYMAMGGAVKAKNGKSFPDLNKDGKITKADILKGRGVIAKKGAKLKKQAAVAIAMKKAGKTPKKMQYGGSAASMVPPAMKKGGKMKKCAYGCK